MLDIEKNLAEVRANIRRAAERAGRSPEDITIIAVTKTFGVAEVMAACKSGINDLGENRVQEAEPKISSEKRITTYSSVVSYESFGWWRSEHGFGVC